MPLDFFKTYQKTFIFILFFLLLCFLGYEIDPNARMDDDYIGEQVYWLMQKGYVKSELMGGFGGIGLENHQAVFHKLWVYNGFLFCEIVGWSIFSLHCASIFYLLVFVGIFYIHIKRKYTENNWFLYGLIAFLFLSHHELKNMAWSFRPEVMVMCLGFISYHFLSIFLDRNQQNQQKAHPNKQIYLILAGIFAGLAFLTHLNGLIFAGAGFGLLLIQKQWKNALIFGIFVTIVFSFYFADILIYTDLAHFWKQFSSDPSLVKSNFGLAGLAERILLEQARYLYTEKEIPLTFLLVLTLSFAWKYFRKLHTNLLNYSLLLMGIMCIWCYSKVPYLLILLLPFLTLLIALGVQYLLQNNTQNKSPKWLPKMMLIGVLAHFGINLVYTFLKIKQNYIAWQTLSTQQTSAQLSQIIKNYEKVATMKDKKILASGNFIFDEINNFKAIKNMAQYDFFIDYHNKPKMNFTQLLDSATVHKINYIILNNEQGNTFEVEKFYPKYPNQITLIKKDDLYWIFKIK